MAKKKLNTFLPDEIGHDFEDQDHILNYRPKIEYIEPSPEFFEYKAPVKAPEDTIDDLRDRTAKLAAGFRAVAALADLAQKRVDNRVEETGSLQVKLDPVKDAHVIAAMKRKFPHKTGDIGSADVSGSVADPTIITYEDYKQAIDCVRNSSAPPPGINPQDIQQAKTDPYRTDFGGFNNQQGENRPEISSAANSVSPLDLAVFQKAGILALFALLYPLIKQEDKKEIIEHMITVPHKPF